MDISVTNSMAFGMKAITSLKEYARKNPDKKLEIDSEKIKKANESIRQALKDAKKERLKAEESASKIILTV